MSQIKPKHSNECGMIMRKYWGSVTLSTPWMHQQAWFSWVASCACKNHTSNSKVLVFRAFNPSPPEEKPGGSLWVPGKPGLYKAFQDSQSFIVRPCKNKFSTLLTLIYLNALVFRCILYNHSNIRRKNLYNFVSNIKSENVMANTLPVYKQSVTGYN